MEREVLKIKGSSSKYPVIIGKKLLQTELSRLFSETGANRICIVTDGIVAKLYGNNLLESVPESILIKIRCGEKRKNLESVKYLWEMFFGEKVDKKTLIVALGGGITGDLAGFASSTYMRGIPLIQAPTTLLAMVDSGIGGKNGFNYLNVKNLIGTLMDPVAVISDLDTLETLPDIEMMSGYAEIIKSMLVGEPDIFNRMTMSESIPLYDLVKHAAMVKIRIVEKDREEKNERVFLNLGHTFGHAIESVSGYKIRHGEAVSVGLVAATKLSAILGHCDEKLSDNVEHLLERFGLPVRVSHIKPEMVYKSILHDKKKHGKSNRFVLPEAPGKIIITEKVPETEIMLVLNYISKK